MKPERIYEILKKTYLSEETAKKAVLCHLHLVVSSGTIFIDVGANIGQYTSQANKLIDKGSIYAIEPDPTRFALLKDNCQKWEHLFRNSIHPLQIAMSDRNNPTDRFYITNSPVSGARAKYDISALEDELQEAVVWQEITLASYTLDTLFKTIDPDLIKIGVGGSELRVLQGATKILKRGKAKFLIEPDEQLDSKEQDRTHENLCSFMKSFGYQPKPFYTQILFINPQKLFFHRVKKAYFKMLPAHFRRRW